ncbi:MAG: hypothetical protein BWY88_01425 [Synergistetes bacterium ADurb.Bin520]|nr:MAG: hypothetical protein BWY88_01425 [Synergistetes bacterium ADurb.Bin520]
MKTKPFFWAALLLFAASGLAAQTPRQGSDDGDDYRVVPTYSLGNQMLMINAGLFVPLFFQSPAGDIRSTNLSLGGVGSLQWSAFLNNEMTLGLEGGGMFAFSPNERNLFMLPVTVRYAYILRWHPLEFPLSIAAGFNFTKLDSSFQILPILKPGASVYWNYSPEWAFGVNFIYWWSPNLYTGATPPRSQSRFGNFLEITFSALYHF